MTHKQKRLLVKLRLTQTDAASMSDRALARELGVSQPFVGSQRRAMRVRLTTESPERSIVRWVRWNAFEQEVGQAACDGDPFA